MDEARDEFGCCGQRQSEAFAGQRVDVAGSVADQEHSAGQSSTDTLAQRPRAPDSGDGFTTSQPVGQLRKRRELVVEPPLCTGQDHCADGSLAIGVM